MTELKKVAFSTLPPTKEKKEKKSKVKVLRINLTLPESNEKSCPEYNYRDLVAIKLVGRVWALLCINAGIFKVDVSVVNHFAPAESCKSCVQCA